MALSAALTALAAALEARHSAADTSVLGDGGGFTGFDVAFVFDNTYTVTHPDSIRTQVEAWKNGGGVGYLDFVCDWDGILNFTTGSLRGPAYTTLTADAGVFGGYVRPAGGIRIRANTGRTPAIGNTIFISGVPLLELKGVGLAAQANGGDGDTLAGFKFQTNTTFPLPSVYAINDCKIGLKHWRPTEPDTEYVKGISTTGLCISAHVEGCDFNGTREQSVAPALFHRFRNNYSRNVIGDICDTLGFTNAALAGYTANVLLEGNTACQMVDDAAYAALHQDFHQTGNSGDLHDGYAVLARYNTVIMSATLSGGTQGIYNDDHPTASSEFVVHDNLILVTSPAGVALWNTDALLSSYVEHNTIMCSNRAAIYDFAQGVRVFDLAGNGAYANCEVTNNIIGLIDDTAGLITASTGNLYVDPRSGIVGGDGTTQALARRPEAVFNGTFSRDGGDFLTYSIPGVGDDDVAVTFWALMDHFEPVGGWGSVVGVSDPATWPTAPARPEGTVGLLSVAIRPDGWSADVTITGWAGKQGLLTYDFGNPLGTSKFAITVTSEGYDAAGVLGTTVRTVYGTAVVRQPYPNEGLLDEVDSGADLVVRVALSDEVYNDDKNGGAGTSGVDPVISVSDSWAHDGTDGTAALVGGAVTNGSALDYPAVVGSWDWDRMRGAWRRVETDFPVAFKARHGFGISAVSLAAVGALSAHSQDGFVTALSANQAAGSGKYHDAYALTALLAGYTQGEQINLRAIAYPTVGDENSILDTDADTSSLHRVYGNTTSFVVCDKTGALKVYGIVDADAGSDGTGAVSATLATARTTPYATIGAAVAAGATVVYVKNTTAVPDILGSLPGTVAAGFYVEVSEDPDDPGVTLDRTGAFSAYGTDFLCYTNIAVRYVSGNGWLDGANGDRQVLFDGVAFDNQARPTVGLAYRSNGCWFVNCTGLGTDDYSSFGTSRVAYAFVGNTITSAFESELINAIANSGNATSIRFEDGATSNPAMLYSNLMYEHNEFLGMVANGGALGSLNIGALANMSNVSVMGDVNEVKSITSSGPAYWIGGDGATFDLQNILLAHDTVVGERCNLFYNDSGVVANVRNRIFVNACAFRSYNIKSDTFASDPNGNRVGNWAQEYGVNYKNNRFDGSASASFVGESIGLDGSFIGDVLVYGEFGFTDDQSTDGGGLGGGDYTPNPAGNLNGVTLLRQSIAFDLNGEAVGNQAGALFVASVSNPVISITGIKALNGVTATPDATGAVAVVFDPTVASIVVKVAGLNVVDGNVVVDDDGLPAIGVTAPTLLTWDDGGNERFVFVSGALVTEGNP